MPEQNEFPVTLNYISTLRTFFHSQIYLTPSFPTHSFADKVIIVTGSNTGLGLEAARHFYRLGAAKLILAVRTVSKGQAAKESIVESVKQRTDADAIEVWELDLSSTASTLAFAEQVNTKLKRLDVVVENAGINNAAKWSTNEGFELTIQVNVVNTFLLALKLLPKLRDTSQHGKSGDEPPHLVIVSSEAHKFTVFKQLNAPNIYEKLNDEKSFDGLERYGVSKLMEILFVRELVSRLQNQPEVIINLVNPGLCYSELDRSMSPVISMITSFFLRLIGRTTEVGSRTYIIAASAGQASHGEFMSDGKNQDVEGWIYSDVGKRAQKKVFDQTMELLESRNPGIGKAVGF